MKFVQNIDVNILKEYLHYEPETGLFTWIKIPSNRVRKGDNVGTIKNNGYIRISINKYFYYAHRLAFLYMTGDWPKGEVDHINGIKDDNRWKNLRDVTRSQNIMNRAAYGKKVTLAKGVYKARNGFAVRVTLGTYYTLEEAIAASQHFYKNHQKEYIHNSVLK